MEEPFSSIAVIIGVITGIAGTVMGIISIRRTNQIKSMDLRLELRKADNELRSSIMELTSTMDGAKRSHQAVASAIGTLQSGAMQAWLSKHETNKIALENVTKRLTEKDFDYHALNQKELESRLVSTHEDQLIVLNLANYYSESIASDNEERRLIKERMNRVFS